MEVHGAPRDEHRLSFMDETGLELMRATGRDQLIQCVWVYEHPIDMHGLERFHRNVAASCGNRLVERSPLLFGRPRWVRATDRKRRSGWRRARARAMSSSTGLTNSPVSQSIRSTVPAGVWSSSR